MADWRKDYSLYRRYFFDIVSLYKRRQDLRSFLEILLSIGTISAFILFAIRPTVVTISELLTTLKAKEDTAAQMDTKINNLKTAQGLLSQNAFPVSLLSTAIPTNPSPETALRQIEAMANRNNVAVLGMNTSEVVILGDTPTKKEDPALKKIPEPAKSFSVSGTFTGTYEALSSFMTDIESARRPIVIDTLVFNAVDAEGGKRIVLSLTGRIPFSK